MTNTTTNEIARPRRKGLNSTVWVLQGMAALAFLAAGAAKLMGSPIMVSEFQAIGVGQWFRYLTGILEVAGAIALVLPRAAYYGALLLVTVMAGALAAHLAKLGLTTAAPAFILLLMSGTIAYFRRAR
jgi:putative oxidoreductase